MSAARRRRRVRACPWYVTTLALVALLSRRVRATLCSRSGAGHGSSRAVSRATIGAGVLVTAIWLFVVGHAPALRPEGRAATVVASIEIPAPFRPDPPLRTMIVANAGWDGVVLRHASSAGELSAARPSGTEAVNPGASRQVGGHGLQPTHPSDRGEAWPGAEVLREPTGDSTAVAAGATRPFVSGGLGLPRADWERIHGEPWRTGYYAQYEQGGLVVGFLDGNVWRIERTWTGGRPVPVEAARGESKALLPIDAVPLRTSAPRRGRTLDVYRGESLRQRFTVDQWGGSEAGTFAVLYRTRAPDGGVTSMMLTLGDAPD